MPLQWSLYIEHPLKADRNTTFLDRLHGRSLQACLCVRKVTPQVTHTSLGTRPNAGHPIEAYRSRVQPVSSGPQHRLSRWSSLSLWDTVPHCSSVWRADVWQSIGSRSRLNVTKATFWIINVYFWPTSSNTSTHFCTMHTEKRARGGIEGERRSRISKTLRNNAKFRHRFHCLASNHISEWIVSLFCIPNAIH